MKKILFKLIAPVIGAFLLALSPVSVSADAGEAPYYGFGTTNGRTDTVNENDYSTQSWDRFEFEYQYNSGSNYRYELGKPTTYTGEVMLDVYSANVRRDKNAAYAPPVYGIFSGNLSTYPTNYYFTQPDNSAYWTAYPQDDPNAIPVYDTLMMGANAQTQGNQMNMYNVGQTGVLPATSIGGNDVLPIGANNATGDYVYQNSEWYYQSGSQSSTTASSTHGEFLPPTSIK